MCLDNARFDAAELFGDRDTITVYKTYWLDPHDHVLRTCYRRQETDLLTNSPDYIDSSRIDVTPTSHERGTAEVNDGLHVFLTHRDAEYDIRYWLAQPHGSGREATDFITLSLTATREDFVAFGTFNVGSLAPREDNIKSAVFHRLYISTCTRNCLSKWLTSKLQRAKDGVK